MERWLGRVSGIYGVQVPKLCQPSSQDTSGEGIFRARPAPEIHLRDGSVEGLISAFRRAHQRAGCQTVGSSADEDVRAWSSSLLYRLRPGRFDTEDPEPTGAVGDYLASSGADTGGASDREAMPQVAGRIQAWSGGRIKNDTFHFYRDGEPEDALIVTVSTPDGEPVGVAATSLAGDHTMVVVHPGHRGRGVGTKAMGALVAEARRRGVPLTATVAEDNPASRRVMERVGMATAGGSTEQRSGGAFGVTSFSV